MALVLGDDEVRAALSPEACRQAMVEALVAHADGHTSFPPRSIFVPDDASGAMGLMGLMPAYRGGPGASFGLKTVCIMPGNPARGLDAHQGLVALFSGETGMATALLSAAALTEIRTAAVSAAATDALARRDASVLAIIGAGVQGRAHLRALAPLRAWREVRIASRRPERARELAERARAGDGVAVSAVGSIREAVDGADVVVCATTSREPVLARDWLAEGAHLNAVGASARQGCELDVATVAAASLFPDSREALDREALEFDLAARAGAIDPETHVRAELGEVLAGRHPGRRDAHELTLFRSLGLGIEDLAAAELAVATARELGLGTEVRL